MKTFVLFVLSLLATAVGFAEHITLENKTSYPKPNSKSKIAIQWAFSGQEVDKNNQAIIDGSQLNPASFYTIAQKGKVSITVPKNAEYFRVLAWSNNESNPDLITNWVDVTPNKCYQLDDDHLVPSVLMSGTGC